MRQQLTRQDVLKMYDNVYTCGYCELQEIEKELKCIGYNSGIYGWNWNAYEIDNNTVLVTGYRNLPFGRHLYHSDCELIRQEYSDGIERVKERFNRWNKVLKGRNEKMKDERQVKVECYKALSEWERARALLDRDPDNVNLKQGEDKAWREYQELLENLTQLRYGHK